MCLKVVTNPTTNAETVRIMARSYQTPAGKRLRGLRRRLSVTHRPSARSRSQHAIIGLFNATGHESTDGRAVPPDDAGRQGGDCRRAVDDARPVPVVQANS